MDPELLQKNFTALPTPDLLDIVSSEAGYTAVAVGLALQELRYRGVSREEICKHVEEYRQIKVVVNQQNIATDITLFQKLYCYFLWLPVFRRLLPNISADGYELKNRQINYYQVLGFVGLMLALAMVSSNAAAAFVVWFIFFLLVFAFDIRYNRNRQRAKLKKLEEAGTLEYEW